MKESGFNDLVRRAQEGDREAMEGILSRVWPYLDEMAHPYENPIRYSGVEAFPIGQKALFRALSRMRRFQIAASDEETFSEFRAWVGQIMRRLGILAEWDNKRLRRRRGKGKTAVPLDRPSTGTGQSSG